MLVHEPSIDTSEVVDVSTGRTLTHRADMLVLHNSIDIKDAESLNVLGESPYILKFGLGGWYPLLLDKPHILRL